MDNECSRCSAPVYRGRDSHMGLCERCLAEAKLTGEAARPVAGGFVSSDCEVCGRAVPYDPLDPVGMRFCSLCERIVCAECTADASGSVCKLCRAEQVLKGEP